MARLRILPFIFFTALIIAAIGLAELAQAAPSVGNP
jgi:hypothetical protein